ncbi:MAG: hypothetical protein B6D35_15060 [Candidatus Brocadia sp. UTAMX2]|jgi:hypothetical protein|nr:MAG: hypothetical protein B6D35_15060 [Candidatus Brocadia sp. UTAMX2]
MKSRADISRGVLGMQNGKKMKEQKVRSQKIPRPRQQSCKLLEVIADEVAEGILTPEPTDGRKEKNLSNDEIMAFVAFLFFILG